MVKIALYMDINTDKETEEDQWWGGSAKETAKK